MTYWWIRNPYNKRLGFLIRANRNIPKNGSLFVIFLYILRNGFRNDGTIFIYLKP